MEANGTYCYAKSTQQHSELPEEKKYKNKSKKLDQNSTKLLRHKYSFMYDEQGNFKNKNSLKGYGLKEARRKSAKFIFNALRSNELSEEEKAFYYYEFSQLILNKTKDYTLGFTEEEGLQFLKLSAEAGYEKARRKYSKYLENNYKSDELYSNLLAATDETNSNFRRSFSFLFRE